jgi:hypothetical protein
MHVKSSVVDSDDLVAEDGDVRVKLGTPQSDLHLGRVAVLGGSDLHSTAFDEDVVSIKSTLVAGIRIRREDKRALNIEEGELRTLFNIEEQVLALGN